MPNLKALTMHVLLQCFADLQTDQWLVDKARDVAQKLLRDDPATVEAHLARWLGQREEFLKV
jgi:ATP-dependent DNA helicase RecG